MISNYCDVYTVTFLISGMLAYVVLELLDIFSTLRGA